MSGFVRQSVLIGVVLIQPGVVDDVRLPPILRPPWSRPMTFEEVYEKYAAQVHRYCVVLLRDAAAAEEVAAQALAQAFAAFDPPDSSDDHIRLWLMRIARNACMDHLRERSRLRRLFGLLVLNREASPDPEALAITHLEMRRLLAALPRLRPRDRDLLALRCGAELSYREIGELLGLSENSATAASHRAMHRLREKLEDQQ